MLLAIDQGTTGTTALLIDKNLQVLGRSTQEFPQHYPKPGWVQHEAAEIWASLERAVTTCLAAAKADPRAIKAIGITNQRETTCLFDRAGKALHPFIVWQCKRSEPYCAQLKAAGHEALFRHKTGLMLDPYFSATKLMWLFDTYPELKAAAQKGQALFGTIDSWLLYRFSGGAAHATDATNASRTLLMDLDTLAYDSELLGITGVPAACLPRIGKSSEIYGTTKGLGFLPDGIPIAALVGDQQGALFGQACFDAGECKITFGTGCFLLLNTGKALKRSSAGLLSSVAVALPSHTHYCLEGSAFIGGAAVQWLRDGLEIITHSSDIEALAATVAETGDVAFVPALAGLGAPHWNPLARGALVGLSRDTGRGHIARAVEEGIAMQNVDIIEAMAKDAGAISLLKVDGGAAGDNLLMQIQSDFAGVACVRPSMTESTALGAAALAGLAVGVFENTDTIKQAWKKDRVFEPKLSADKRQRQRDKWQRAVKAVQGLAGSQLPIQAKTPASSADKT